VRATGTTDKLIITGNKDVEGAKNVKRKHMFLEHANFAILFWVFIQRG